MSIFGFARTTNPAPQSTPATGQTRADVNGLVPLFTDAGKLFHVAAADVEHFLRSGARRQPHDVEALVSELDLVFPEAQRAVREFLAHVAQTGTLDHSADAPAATAAAALNRLHVAGQQLLYAIHLSLPNKEPEPVRLRAPRDIDLPGDRHVKAGEIVQVDPTQADTFKGYGLEEVVSP